VKYIGIDLGTTNSAICSFDGVDIRIYKNPEQQDVTPSAIYIDNRGHKFYGLRAYENAARNPDRAATGFKRAMGTNTPIKLTAANVTLSPEECSAEILRLLYGFLPEEMRDGDDTGTVITVPAAFNQMQKDSTMSAANAAAVGRVALMQEPVAAVMSAMRHRKGDGTFVIYDLGGGTLDIVVAQSTSGRVSVLAGGGIAMCGGRDFDRELLDKVVTPWLFENFDLPEDLHADPQYNALLRLAKWAGEKAKIELSQKAEASIVALDHELRIRDQSGAEIYIDIPLSRSQLDELIAPKLEESIEKTRETLAKAHLTADDIERIVFVGGPTCYKPLRDKVARELGIAPSTDVNPMTAVAEGAAVFAESVDWSSASRGRKSSKAALSATSGLGLSLNYISRTPDTKARIAIKLAQPLDQFSFQIDNPATGWSSGRMALAEGTSLEVQLVKPGENAFKLFVFDSDGRPINLGEDSIVISRTAASVDGIPASHSIAIEAREKLGGRTTLRYLVKEGDQLPKKGRVAFRAEESLRAGSADSIRFKLWEGDISDPIADNRFIGLFEVKGSHFDDGVIAAGAELFCDYEILDSGNINLEVSVPSIGGAFGNNQSFYSPQQAKIDFTQASQRVAEQSQEALDRLDEMTSKVEDPRLDEAREKLEQAQSVNPGEADPDVAMQAMERVQEAMRLLALTRKEHLSKIRQLELDKVVAYFNMSVREHARPTEVSAFENLTRTAQRVIGNPEGDFEAHVDELRGKNFSILWRQDWFVIDRFKRLAKSSYLFSDAREQARLIQEGDELLKASDIEELRSVVAKLDSLRFGSIGDADILATANIVVV